MKVQATVLLLCFLSGIFLSAVVHAKPSPALMKELIALEKYLEKKQGSDGGDGQNQDQGGKPIGDHDLGSFLNNIGPQERPNNENNNAVDGEDSGSGQKAPDVNKETDVGVPPENPEESVPPKKPEESAAPEKPEESVLPPKKPEESATPEKPEESVPPKKPEESATPEKPEEDVQPGKPEEVGGEDGENPQEGSGPNQSEGQEETGREQAAAELDRAIRNIKASLKILETLGDNYGKEFNSDDRKLNELKAKVQETKEKTNERLGELETVVQKFKEVTEKKSVKENALARRSHLSDTEFLNIVHSLLTNN